MGELFMDSRACVGWAEEDIDLLAREVEFFRRDGNCGVSMYADPYTDQLIVKVGPPRLPDEIKRRTACAVMHLRSSLEYLIYSLARRRLRRDLTKNERTQFPICDSPEDFASKRASWLVGLNKTEWAFAERFQPYKRNRKWIAEFRDFSNPAKHRYLPRAVPWLEPSLTAEKLAFAPGAERYARPFPDGITELDIDMNVRLGIRIGVTFRDGTPVIPRLQAFHSQIAQVVEAFDKRFDP